MAEAPRHYYELYRRSSIGLALTDTLDDLISSNKIEPQLALKVLAHFDKAIADVLTEKVRARLGLKGPLYVYRFCDDVWTFVVKDVDFKLDNSNTIHADRIKIVALKYKKTEGEQKVDGSAAPLKTTEATGTGNGDDSNKAAESNEDEEVFYAGFFDAEAIDDGEDDDGEDDDDEEDDQGLGVPFKQTNATGIQVTFDIDAKRLRKQRGSSQLVGGCCFVRVL